MGRVPRLLHWAMLCCRMCCVPNTNMVFSGGAELCLDPGPLGTGLLCRVNASGVVTQSACCGSGVPCELPAGSCCESGSCSTCPHYDPQTKLFARLNEPETDPHLRRQFNSDKSSCDSVPASSPLSVV